MPVPGSMPSFRNRWLLFPSGVLGTENTFHFRGPLSTRLRSLRLFLWFFLLWCFLIASQESLTDLEAGVAVGMAAHLALWTDDQRRTYLIALLGLPLRITNDLRTATGAFPASLLRVDPAGDNPGLVPRLILAVAENAPFHPEGSLLIAPVTVAAFLRLQIAQMLEHYNGGSLLSSELDNAMTDLVSNILVTLIDFAPQSGIILLAKCK